MKEIGVVQNRDSKRNFLKLFGTGLLVGVPALALAACAPSQPDAAPTPVAASVPTPEQPNVNFGAPVIGKLDNGELVATLNLSLDCFDQRVGGAASEDKDPYFAQYIIEEQFIPEYIMIRAQSKNLRDKLGLPAAGTLEDHLNIDLKNKRITASSAATSSSSETVIFPITETPIMGNSFTFETKGGYKGSVSINDRMVNTMSGDKIVSTQRDGIVVDIRFECVLPVNPIVTQK